MTAIEVQNAERAVVGDCIMAPHNVRSVAGFVSPADFADPRLGQVFGLIVGMASAHGPEAVTQLTVVEEIRRRLADPEQANRKHHAAWLDFADLASIITHGFSGIPETHARMVRDAAIGREVAAFCRRNLNAVESGQDPHLITAQLVEGAKSIRDGSQTKGLKSRLLADVFADEDPGYDWLIPGLLERLDRLMYTGGEGAGKSTFGRQVALSAAAGLHPFKDERFKPVRVTIVDVENSEVQWRRKARGISLAVRSITGTDPSRMIELCCTGRLDITKPDGIGAVHSLLDEKPCDLLLIGPLYKLVPRAITSDDDAAPLLAALDSIRERADGPALMMEAHAGHTVGAGGERNYRPRGSSALLGWPEFGFGFATDQKDPARVEVIRWRGDRDERDWPKAMRRGGTLPWTDDRDEPSQAEQEEALRQSRGLRSVGR